jgi:LacI family transcriptional regulator
MSLQKLAESLGLSVSTVSRALNGYSDVSALTRNRVEQAAQATNYRPHPAAHRLATGRTNAITLISSVREGSQFDASFEPLMVGVTQGLAAHGYFAMAMSLTSGSNELTDFERMLDARLADGVILTRTRPFDPRVAMLQERGVPFVTHGRTRDNRPHAWVDTDNKRAMQLATERLIALGHKRIALINGPLEMNFALLRGLGFEAAIAAAGLDQASCPQTQCELSAVAGELHAAELLMQQPRPTALVCASDVVALGASKACRALGLQVGRDVSITGYGNSEPAVFADPPIASIEHAATENGRHLAALLLRRLGGEPVVELNWLEPVSFLERRSIGPPA